MQSAMLTFDKNSGMAVPTAFLAEPGDSLTNWSSKKTLCAAHFSSHHQNSPLTPAFARCTGTQAP